MTDRSSYVATALFVAMAIGMVAGCSDSSAPGPGDDAIVATSRICEYIEEPEFRDVVVVGEDRHLKGAFRFETILPGYTYFVAEFSDGQIGTWISHGEGPNTTYSFDSTAARLSKHPDLPQGADRNILAKETALSTPAPCFEAPVN